MLAIIKHIDKKKIFLFVKTFIAGNPEIGSQFLIHSLCGNGNKEAFLLDYEEWKHPILPLELF